MGNKKMVYEIDASMYDDISRCTLIQRPSKIMAEGLSADSIRDILCRLSVKSLVRFKSVSKPWCCLIDDPYFINFHLKHSAETNRDSRLILGSSPSPVNLLCSEDLDQPGNLVEINLPVLVEENGTVESISLLGSCNGLICCLIHTTTDLQSVIIWNKSTGDFHIARSPPDRTRCQHLTGVMQHGFGYDPINDDYKVVGIGFLHDETTVYSLRNTTWKSKQHKGLPYIYELLEQNKGVLVGGALHWMAGKDVETGRPNLVLAFDLTTELFHEISLPEQHTSCTAVGALGGSLTVTCRSRLGLIEIWAMEDLSNKSWTKLLQVAVSNCLWMEPFRPLTYSRGGNKILLKSEFWNDIRWYNLENEELKHIPINHPVLEIEICLDTLVSVSAYASCKDDGLQQLRKKSREIGI